MISPKSLDSFLQTTQFFAQLLNLAFEVFNFLFEVIVVLTMMVVFVCFFDDFHGVTTVVVVVVVGLGVLVFPQEALNGRLVASVTFAHVAPMALFVFSVTLGTKQGVYRGHVLFVHLR